MTTLSIAQTRDIFQAVRDLNFADVFSLFHVGEIRRNKALCPFHAEKTASFHIYANGFFCFGCGESGDSITFVAKLHGLRPVEAARTIAEHFCLAGGGYVPLATTARLQAQTERELQKKLDGWAFDTARRCRIIIDAIHFLLEQHGVNMPDDLLELVHKKELLEHWRDTLLEGDTEQKLLLYRSINLRRWFA